jgi:hypothetical protein
VHDWGELLKLKQMGHDARVPTENSWPHRRTPLKSLKTNYQGEESNEKSPSPCSKESLLGIPLKKQTKCSSNIPSIPSIHTCKESLLGIASKNKLHAHARCHPSIHGKTIAVAME